MHLSEDIMSKILFIDVDGTLVDYTNHLPESAVTAIRKARANGHRVYICTGRSRAEVYANIWDIGIDGMIGGNGSMEDKKSVAKSSVKTGITFGSALAMVISYTTWHSVGWGDGGAPGPSGVYRKKGPGRGCDRARHFSGNDLRRRSHS